MPLILGKGNIERLPPQYHPQGSFTQCENYKSKYFIPKGVPEWKAICSDPTKFRLWDDCTPAEKDTFHANFPGEPDPYGLLLYCRRWTYWFRPHPKGMAILVR